MRRRQPIGISCVNYCDVIASAHKSYDTMSYHINCILLYHEIVCIVWYIDECFKLSFLLKFVLLFESNKWLDFFFFFDK